MPSSLSRRKFIQKSACGTVALRIAPFLRPIIKSWETPVKLGLIADLHQDIMHDGLQRMKAFTNAMKTEDPIAVIQLGDFAYPHEKNMAVIDLFNQSHVNTLHVIGNHDTDSGHTKEQCLEVWKMPSRYYTQDINGLRIIVLDGNEKGSPAHTGGYVSYIGTEQQNWLREQLAASDKPVIIVSHQPLAGTIALNNAREMQNLLAAYADKILIALNGHSHIDQLLRIKRVNYLHINSASYYWVGGDYKHESFSTAIHEAHPWISSTCPYRDSLFTTLTIDPTSLTLKISGKQSSWVGPSPAALGVNPDSDLIVEKTLCPTLEIKPSSDLRRMINGEFNGELYIVNKW